MGFPDYWMTIQSTTTKIVQIYRHRLSIKTYIGTESGIQDKIMHLYNLGVSIQPRCEEKIMYLCNLAVFYLTSLCDQIQC